MCLSPGNIRRLLAQLVCSAVAAVVLASSLVWSEGGAKTQKRRCTLKEIQKKILRGLQPQTMLCEMERSSRWTCSRARNSWSTPVCKTCRLSMTLGRLPKLVGTVILYGKYL